MFSTAIEDEASEVADFFFLPASASTTVQSGTPIEEVRFMRDEMANLVWAIEHVTENALGQPWHGHEREVATRAAPDEPPPATPSTPPLHYQLQAPVPAHWIPFLPVALDRVRGETSSRTRHDC